MKFSSLMPKYCSAYCFKDVLPLFKFYGDLLPVANEVVWREEFIMWQRLWKDSEQNEMPHSAVASLEACNEDIFENIAVMLRVCIIPVRTLINVYHSDFRYYSRFKRNTRANILMHEAGEVIFKNDDDGNTVERTYAHGRTQPN